MPFQAIVRLMGGELEQGCKFRDLGQSRCTHLGRRNASPVTNTIACMRARRDGGQGR
jgi:hypothetical protein